VSVQTTLKNLYPVDICWPIAFTFIKSNMISYHEIKEAQNKINNEKEEGFHKAKLLLETDSKFSPNPSYLFQSIRKTLDCMFHSSLPLFGTTLQFDDV